MIVSEEEAKDMRCQETFTLMRDPGDAVVIEWHNCVGSACMAWRWAGVRSGNALHDSDNAKAAVLSGNLTGYAPGSVPIGYCGKAGKP